MSQAITDDLILAVRMASFSPLNQEVVHDVVKEISKTMVILGHKHNFLVYGVSADRKLEKNT